MITELQEKLNKLISEREQAEKKGLERVKELEKEKKNLQMELEKKQVILKAKEKQAKLNQIKIKEIMRIAKFGQIQEEEANLLQNSTIKPSHKQSNNTSF